MTDAIYPLTFRRAVHQSLGGAAGFGRGTEWESLAVAQMEDPGTELARAGKRYMGGCQVIAAGIAPDATLPTTTAKLVLYNSASTGGVSLAVRRIAWALGSGTAAAGAALYLGTATAVVATPPSMASNYACVSCSGSSTASVAVWGTAVTMPASTKWAIATAGQQLAAANVGQGIAPVDLDGGIIIRPGYALAIAIFSAAGTTPLYSVGAFWSELQLDNE